MNNVLKSLNVLFCFLILSGCVSFSSLNQVNESTRQSADQVSIEKARILYEIGKVSQANGDYNEAKEAYDKALMLDDSNPDIYNGLGIVYALQNEHELAITLINEAIQRAPMASYLHNNLGYVYLIKHRLTEAAGAFERALQLDPGNVHARQNLDLTYKKLGCSDNQPPCGQWQEPSQP